tara:strand:+ start:27747 stop:28739 length:993 start_codon:yes stop_codon:yes gene_type:complete
MEQNSLQIVPEGYVIDRETNTCYPKGTGFGGKHTVLPREYRELLSQPIPPGMISTHPTKKYLSVIKAIAVVERMNDVFGIAGWDLEHEIVKETVNVIEQTQWDNAKRQKVVIGKKETPYILMKGRMYIKKFDLYTPYQYGGHETDGTGTEPADGFKSAATDIQSKCGSYLEIGIQVFKGQPTSNVANVSKQDTQEAMDQGVKNLTAKSESVSKTDGSNATKQEVDAAKKRSEAAKKAAATRKKNKEAKDVESNENIEDANVVVDERSEEREKSYNKVVNKINSFVSSDAIKEESGALQLDIKFLELGEETEVELKQMVNSRYSALKKQGL